MTGDKFGKDRPRFRYDAQRPGFAARCAAISRRLRTDETGSVAIIFAVSLIPLLGITGFALDYARASLGRAQLQSAVDAAGLAVAHLPRTTSVGELQQKASDWVNASLAGKDLGPVTVTAEKVGTSIRFTATTTVGLSLFRILRKEPIAVSAGNEVSWDLGKVEVVLVLDNTGSMVQNGSPKLANLKTAATALVDQLGQAAEKPDQVKIGVVPFSMTVNVGAQYQNAAWIDQTGLSSINKEIFYNGANPSRFTLLQQMKLSWAGCIEYRPAPHDVQESPPSSGTPDSLYVPFFAPDEPDYNYDGQKRPVYNDYLEDGSTSTNWFRRQGRTAKYDDSAIKKSINTQTGPNAGCALQPLQRLTSDLSAVKTKITSMTAVGETNIPIGLIWGWHVLSPNAPFADGVAYNTKDVTKFVVLMTDGENTNSERSNPNDSIYSSLGYVWQKRLGLDVGSEDYQRTKAMDARLRTLCENVKASGIKIFTVGVEVPTSALAELQRCASEIGMFYNVTNSSGMTAVFSRIAETITQLRLSK